MVVAWCGALASPVHAAQVGIGGPIGSGEFGRTVTILPNGNIVVTDPAYEAPGSITNVGAVHLYRPTGALISTLRGTTTNDRVGSGGIVTLPNGNFLVQSPTWANGATANAGALTFVSGTTGLDGVVSSANSLVGSNANDLAFNRVTVLANGNFVVASILWNHGAIADAGAATFGTATSGVSGAVSPLNSLVGGSAGDQVGGYGVIALPNGNYLVHTLSWDHGAAIDAGAVTFGSGVVGISGAVSPANSLVGSSAGDRIGNYGVYGVNTLTNGNYVVNSYEWDNGAIADAGAATFGSGVSGVTGPVSASNSLVGSSANDRVGVGLTALTNGNYVVQSRHWANGPAAEAGAATLGAGDVGISGPVTPSNSLVGSASGDGVGLYVAPLTNGNYVVGTPNWNNAAGAATFGSGTVGVSGPVTAANSLIGSKANDRIGQNAVALANGNYVIQSSEWSYEALARVGAATFGSGITGIIGVVSPSNSLVGGSANDQVGLTVTALMTGNYVVGSPMWDNGVSVDAGSATFGPGGNGISGTVSATNSLVGSTAFDRVGVPVVELSNGNYVVRIPSWDNGSAADAGAVTFGSGAIGVSGPVSPTNSLVGGSTSDSVGNFGVEVLSNGNYVVLSPYWDFGAASDAGAATFGSGTSGASGLVSPANSLIGGSGNDRAGAAVLPSRTNEDYVVLSRFWANGGALEAGAATLGAGATGITGMISPANSLVGSVPYDRIGSSGTALSNGNFLVGSALWDNAATVDAGAVTLALSNGSVTGPVTETHGVLGLIANQGSSLVSSYDETRNQLAVGQPAANRVVLHRTGIATSTSIVAGTPDPSISGQPVSFTASVSATPDGPTNGRVTFTASSGESCVDTTPTAASATTAEFSCTMTIVAVGTSTVIAEYTGSVIHAYSGSAPETHTTIGDVMFGNGFENP